MTCARSHTNICARYQASQRCASTFYRCTLKTLRSRSSRSSRMLSQCRISISDCHSEGEVAAATGVEESLTRYIPAKRMDPSTRAHFRSHSLRMTEHRRSCGETVFLVK